MCKQTDDQRTLWGKVPFPKPYKSSRVSGKVRMIEKTKVLHFRKLTADMSRSINMLTGKRRLQRIEDLQRLLNFERRLAMLTREEWASMNKSGSTKKLARPSAKKLSRTTLEQFISVGVPGKATSTVKLMKNRLFRRKKSNPRNSFFLSQDDLSQRQVFYIQTRLNFIKNSLAVFLTNRRLSVRRRSVI